MTAVPGEFADNVHANVTEAPALKETLTGSVPLIYVTAEAVGVIAFTFSMPAPPVFVIVTFTLINWPTLACAGSALTCIARTAGLCIATKSELLNAELIAPNTGS